MERVILHSDLNCFYAAVECLHHPELRDKAVAVCGDPEMRHGIVLTANYNAKRMGVKTGDAIWQAQEKCPNLVTVPPDFNQYLRFSKAAREIYNCYTDQVEPFGIDEAWLDVSQSVKLFGSGEKLANEIRERIRFEMGITASIGVSFNKVFAKLGSDYKKPDATTVITKKNFREVVWPLPAKDLLYVGPATSQKLSRYGIRTIGQLAEMDPKNLEYWFGKWGLMLWHFANGMDSSPVSLSGAPILIKSVGNSTTAPRDLTCDKDVRMAMYILCDSVAERLREQHFKGHTVSITIRDTDLYSFTRQGKTALPTCLTDEITHKAFSLFKRNYTWSKPVRSLGVNVSDLSWGYDPVQLDFYANTVRREKKEDLEKTVDGLRQRFGHSCILRGTALTDPLFASMNPKGDHIIHPTSFLKGGTTTAG